MISSNKRGSGDYLCFMVVIPGDVFPGADAGWQLLALQCRAGDSAQGWGTSVLSRGVGGCAGDRYFFHLHPSQNLPSEREAAFKIQPSFPAVRSQQMYCSPWLHFWVLNMTRSRRYTIFPQMPLHRGSQTVSFKIKPIFPVFSTE